MLKVSVKVLKRRLARTQERVQRIQKVSFPALTKQLARLQERVGRIQADIETAKRCNSAIPLKQVASLLHVSGMTVRRMIDDGRLKGFQLGSSKSSWWWITKRSIHQFAKRLASQYPPRSQRVPPADI